MNDVKYPPTERQADENLMFPPLSHSLGLALGDFWLFPKIKSAMKWKHDQGKNDHER